MKDFDVDRQQREDKDRSFRLGGEVFHYRPAVAPETLLRWSEFAEDGAASEREGLERLDETILGFIDPADSGKWAKVRNPSLAHPLGFQDLNALVEWLVEEVVGRPTGEPSDSPVSPDGTGTGSTEGSSSPEAAVSTASPPARSATSRSRSKSRR